MKKKGANGISTDLLKRALMCSSDREKLAFAVDQLTGKRGGHSKSLSGKRRKSKSKSGAKKSKSGATPRKRKSRRRRATTGKKKKSRKAKKSRAK
jgi:hypothetical protein